MTACCSIPETPSESLTGNARFFGETIIRPAVSADCHRITNLATVAYGRYLERMDKKPAPMIEDYAGRIAEGLIFVLEIQSSCPDGEKRDLESQALFSTSPAIAGFIMLSPGKDAMLLNNLAVHPAVQGQGYGKKLMAFAEGMACKAGFCRISLYTNEVMTENLRFYHRLGYTETHRATEEGFNRVFFSKNL
ncbi:MAG: GNAT family N-acetyltransferase [Desulfovibrio sp.]|jgi:ribosomal protein S18 acetylase RimI-like enzyme|nr:GNAT family N-acetyltransferase [Desulfovibrio sp.]